MGELNEKRFNEFMSNLLQVPSYSDPRVEMRYCSGFMAEPIEQIVRDVFDCFDNSSDFAEKGGGFVQMQGCTQVQGIARKICFPRRS